MNVSALTVSGGNTKIKTGAWKAENKERKNGKIYLQVTVFFLRGLTFGSDGHLVLRHRM